MRKIVVISSLLIIFMFLVACAPKVSDEQLQKDLSKLSPEEWSALRKEVQNNNAAGNAVATRYSASDRTQLVRVLNNMRAAQATKPKPTLNLTNPKPSNITNVSIPKMGENATENVSVTKVNMTNSSMPTYTNSTNTSVSNMSSNKTY